MILFCFFLTRPPLPNAYFIKVPIQKSTIIAKLKKAELVYENCRLEIDGEINSEKLFSIVQIMEAK